jgi:hypothetical protein
VAASCQLVALHCPAARMPLSAVANAARCCTAESAISLLLLAFCCLQRSTRAKGFHATLWFLCCQRQEQGHVYATCVQQP